MGQLQIKQTSSSIDVSKLPNGLYFLICPEANLGVLKMVVNH
jgi:hypothetical protein